MTAVAFDTLKFSRKLREAGFSAEQADKTSDALAEAMDGAQLATKSDIRRLEERLDAKVDKLELRMVIKFGAMQLAGIALLLAGLKYVSI